MPPPFQLSQGQVPPPQKSYAKASWDSGSHNKFISRLAGQGMSVNLDRDDAISVNQFVAAWHKSDYPRCPLGILTTCGPCGHNPGAARCRLGE